MDELEDELDEELNEEEFAELAAMREHGGLEEGEIPDDEEDVHLEIIDISNIHSTELHDIQATSIEHINTSPKNKISCKV